MPALKFCRNQQIIAHMCEFSKANILSRCIEANIKTGYIKLDFNLFYQQKQWLVSKGILGNGTHEWQG